MFGGMFFSNKVSSQLFKMGYKPRDMPDMTKFKLLCDGLYANGYSAERAALLFHGVFNSNPDSISEMRRRAGTAGLLFLGPEPED
jgi:hypothetical protein